MQEAIYKGATRPPVLFGVPLVPAVLIGGVGILGVSYALVLSRSLIVALIVLAVVAIGWTVMALVTRKDDQRLMQHLLRWRLRQARASHRRWGAFSYGSGVVRGMKDRPRR